MCTPTSSLDGVRHERVALGRVIMPKPIAIGPACIGCDLDSEGCTVQAWMLFDESGPVYPMCFWCLELWELRGWLRSA